MNHGYVFVSHFVDAGITCPHREMKVSLFPAELNLSFTTYINTRGAYPVGNFHSQNDSCGNRYDYHFERGW